jgi:hypothetical protein
MRAYTALRRLSGDPDGAVPFLAQHLRPVDSIDRPKLTQLISDLDSPRFALRQKATQELALLGDKVLPDLHKALAAKPSLELRQRLEQIISSLQSWSPEQLQALRAVEALELIGTPEARQVLMKLAAGALEARLTQEAKASAERLATRAASAQR